MFKEMEVFEAEPELLAEPHMDPDSVAVNPSPATASVANTHDKQHAEDEAAAGGEPGPEEVRTVNAAACH